MPNSRRINFLRALFPTLENTFGSRPKSHASRPRVCANLLSLLPPRLYRLVSANFSTIFLHNYDPGPSCAATLRVYIDPNLFLYQFRVHTSNRIEQDIGIYENGGNLEFSFPSSPFFDRLSARFSYHVFYFSSDFFLPPFRPENSALRSVYCRARVL